MNEGTLANYSLSDVARLIRSREISPVDVLRSVLEAIENENGTLNCFITVTEAEAYRQAKSAEKSLKSGEWRGPLHGIPISVKDNIATAGIKTTCGSPVMDGWIPNRDASVVALLKNAGAVIVGKTNMNEFAYGGPHPKFGRVLNPWNAAYDCGGSSSGSAAAVAAGLGYGSIGTDTGGSVRIPAAYCGVVGCKPTFGLLNKKGVVPVSYNLDHVGVMAKTVEDTAILLDCLTAGHRKAGYGGLTSDALHNVDLSELKVGILPLKDCGPLDPSVQAAVAKTYKRIERLAKNVVEISLPDPVLSWTAMWVISGAEAAEYHRKMLSSKAREYSAKVRALLERGDFIPAVDYVRAQRVRQLLIEKMAAIFSDVDVILTPATPVPSFPLGAESIQIGDVQISQHEVSQRFVVPFNLTGHPAVAVPIGLSKENLPLAVQVVGRAFQEPVVLEVAKACELHEGSVN